MTAAHNQTPDETSLPAMPKPRSPRRAKSQQQASGSPVPIKVSSAAQNSAQTKETAIPVKPPSGPLNLPSDHDLLDAQNAAVGGDTNSQQAIHGTVPNVHSPAEANVDSSIPIELPNPHTSVGMLLFDPLLHTLAAGLDDIEKTKNQQGNRYRQLTRTVEDKDGEERGFGLTEDHPAVAALALQLETLEKLNTGMTKALEKQLKAHPLWPWIEAQKGLGPKTTARLLHAIRDPYWNDLYDRPRTVSELWAFCGLHVLPAGHNSSVSHGATAGGSNSAGGDASQFPRDTRGSSTGVAPRRKRGQKANWSTDAKTRCYLIAESMVKNRASAYRALYDAGREKYADSVHAAPCAQCSALPGAPLKDGHKHARAMRLVMKEVLKDLWVESKRIYEAQEQS